MERFQASYSAAELRRLTGGVPVSPILPYEPFTASAALFNENRGRISLSGAQSKFSMCIRNGFFVMTKPGEQGTHILKPALTDFENGGASPANEDLTMQIAERVFGIETAAHATCRFTSGESAYITRRYDVAPDGSKIQQEDFASLAGISAETHGRDFKYSALSYEDLGGIIRRYLPAWRIELVRFFDRILFNFLFSNGDAHIKNFSVLRYPEGDYRLAPAYDLIDTRLHLPDEEIFALRKGLFADGRRLPLGPDRQVFLDFGKALGLSEKVIRRELDRYSADYPAIRALVDASGLPDGLKETYYLHYRMRLVSYLRA